MTINRSKRNFEQKLKKIKKQLGQKSTFQASSYPEIDQLFTRIMVDVEAEMGSGNSLENWLSFADNHPLMKNVDTLVNKLTLQELIDFNLEIVKLRVRK
jgi:hypothetical protein